MQWHDLSDLQKKQYIDAESVFMALRDAEKAAQAVRGSMLWRQVHGNTFLVRTNTDNSQKSLGPRSADTEAVYDKFMARKKLVSDRITGLRQALQLHQKLNRAHRVGRTPEIVVKILNQLHKSGIGDHFMTVGTHAMFAFESAAGVRFVDEATTTQDIDLLMDTQKHLLLASTLQGRGETLLSTLQKVDPTFDLRDDQRYTAVNAAGFEVDVIRRAALGACAAEGVDSENEPQRGPFLLDSQAHSPAMGQEAGEKWTAAAHLQPTPLLPRRLLSDDPHPLQVTAAERDFWVVQVGNGAQMASAERFVQMVVSASGHMALMTTLHPAAFSRLKQALSRNPGRDPLKKSRDALQARAVAELLEEVMPHLRATP